MPIFEYHCKTCCHLFEQLLFTSDTEPTACPVCNCNDIEKLMSAGAVRPNGIPSGSGGFTPPPCKPSAGG